MLGIFSLITLNTLPQLIFIPLAIAFPRFQFY